MKKNLFTFYLALLSIASYAANIDITWNYSGPNTAVAIPASFTARDKINLTVANLSTTAIFDTFMQNSTIAVAGGAPTTLQVAFSTALGAAGYAGFRAGLNITSKDLVSILTAPLQSGDVVAIILKDAGGIKNLTSTFTIAPPAPVGITTEQWMTTKMITINGKQVSLGKIYDNQERYEKEQNMAYLIVDENGNLLGNNPVNIDQDDVIILIVIGDQTTISNFSVDFVGTYAPVDLQMRSFEKPAANFNQNAAVPPTLDAKVFTRGPFTSETVEVKVKKSGTLIATYSLRVNKLFHLGFGVGVNITDLIDPDFEITAIDATTNTITSKNDSKRTIFSLNVVWYWRSTLLYWQRGSNITRGRDVLKEPMLIERINPTFGISLDGKMRDNIFAGVNFEFARGGSINLGYHWGKVTKLNLDGFELGTTPFTGTTVPTSEEWDGRFFVGVMLDTRIINTLFNNRP